MRAADFNASEVASYYRARFPNLKQAGAEWRGSCPVHQGDDANFAVNPENGLAYCHSQCGRGWSILQLEQTLSGRRWKECRDDVNVIVGRPVRGPAKLTEVATYDYTDAKGEFLFQVVRYEPKTFRQRRRVVKMDGTSAGISWEYNIKGISRVLYRLPKVAAADRVLIVEGEKDVGNLEKLGFVATCNPGGACTHAGKWLKNYTEALEGKRVVVLPDNDPPGQQHANVVVQAIRHRVAELRMLAVPEGKDASDWIAAGATRDVIQQAIDAAPIIAEQKAAGDGSGESPPTPGALAAAPGTPGLPQIQVNDRPFRLICEEAVGALRSFNDPPNLFVRASRIACIEATELGRPFIADFDDTKTRHHLAQAADFFELSPRGIRREVPPPIDVAKNVRGRNPATWGFPVLEGVAEAPTLRPDGSVLAQPGYDALSRLYLVPSAGLENIEVPDQPSREAVEAGLEVIRDVIGDFPFVDQASYANAVGAMITAVYFDVQAALDAAAICNTSVTKLVGAGSETQFVFRGTLQEEKPLRDWLQEVLMNCLGYYTFAFGKIKVGARANSSTVEAFTEGNTVFRSLQLAPAKPTFNHLTANFADEDFAFVNNSVAVYDIDHASHIGGGAGPMYLKSTVNLCGTSSKSQAARIVSVRLREELGGTSAAEWKAARQIAFKTTVLALNTEPGMVCSMTHADMPGGVGEFRVVSWRLNKDFSIDIQGRTTTDSMYDLTAGPKPADVVPTPVPEEILYDIGVPGILEGTPKLSDYAAFVLDEMEVLPDASGNMNIAGAHEVATSLYYVDELAVDLWASLDAAIDRDTDPVTVACTMNPDTARTFKVGDFVIFNDEAKSPDVGYLRSYECAQIVGPGNEGDVVPSGNFQFQRKPEADPRPERASFETRRCPHAAGIRFFKLDSKTFTFSVKKGFFRTPGLPARIEIKIPSVCVVAAVAGVANNFGYGPFTTFPLSHHSEPFMPGDRTCNGGAYTFQIPGALAVADTVAIPMRVQDSASIRCIYAYVQTPTTDGQSAYLVKVSRDDGATWESLEYMGIAQMLPDGAKNTYDFLLGEGYGKPATRRLPYNDFGVILAQNVTHGGGAQTVNIASYGANHMSFDVGEFAHVNLGQADEEYVEVLAGDPVAQTFNAVFTKDHSMGATVRPTIWPTQILYEGDTLAFDILAVASPDPGSDLTVVIQT